MTGWALAVLAAAEVALVGWWLTTGVAALLAFGQILVLALLALVLLHHRYVGFRRAHELNIARTAVQHERLRLAEDLHDVLGHELSLIAVRAGALQVSTGGRAADLAADLRGQVEQAVLQLRQTVQLLHTGGPLPASVEPADLDVSALVHRARDAGADITTSGCSTAAVPAPVRLTAYRLVQECLTNAAKHAPGAPITIRVDEQDGVLDITVETDGGHHGDLAAESGLANLRRRIEAIGGQLQAGRGAGAAGGRHLTHARIPLSGTAARTGATADRGAGVSTSRRPGAATLRWAVVPAAVLTAATTGFYGWASHDATLEQRAFDRLSAGQPAAQARTALPGREAPIRLVQAPSAPPTWRCAYYTDGNFPLAMAAFEVCDDGTRLVRVSDLRKVPLR